MYCLHNLGQFMKGSRFSCLRLRELYPVVLKALYPYPRAFFSLQYEQYWRVEETPDYAKTKAFRVLCSFKTSYFCRYKEKNEAMLSLARLFDAVTAKRGRFKTVLV